MAKSGRFTVSVTGASSTISWSASENIENNNYTVSIKRTTSGSAGIKYANTYVYWQANASSNQQYITGYSTANFTASFHIPSGGILTISADITTTSLNFNSQTATFQIDVIDRASNPTLSKTSITLDDTPLTITTNRKSTNFIHAIVGGFSTNAMNDTLAQNVTDSVTISSFPVATYASQITDNESKSYIIRTITYKNGVAIGQNDKTITLIVPDSIRPSVTGDIEVEDVWCYRDLGIFYNKYSILAAHCTEEQTAYGSPIVSRTLSINGRSAEASTETVTMTEPVSFEILPQETPLATFTIKDGRGRTASKTVPIPLMNYNIDFLSIERVTRALSNGTEDTEGTYVKIIGTFNKTSVLDENDNEQNFTYIAVYVNNDTTPLYTSGNVDSSDASGNIDSGDAILLGSANSSFDINSTYNIRIIYGDAVSGYHEYEIFTIPTVLRPISINADGSAISFGKPCLSTDRGMYVYYDPVYIMGKLVASHIGQIIMSTTLDTETKVIAEYGGTKWVQHDGYFLRGASTGVTASYIDENEELVSNNVADGGEETHTLTADEIPSHNHGSSGAISNGITGGSHAHTYEYKGEAASKLSGDNPTSEGFGSVYRRKSPTEKTGLSTEAATHTHNLPNHTHSSVGGGQAHNNMPPYKDVYIWERVA